MSRSYKKYASAGICCGSNTEYYRDRNRNTRNKNKHIIRNIFKRYDVDELADIDGFEFIENKRNPNYDTWNEPTDGKWHARTFRDYLNMCVPFLYYKERDIKEHLNNFKRYKRK